MVQQYRRANHQGHLTSQSWRLRANEVAMPCGGQALVRHIRLRSHARTVQYRLGMPLCQHVRLMLCRRPSVGQWASLAHEGCAQTLCTRKVAYYCVALLVASLVAPALKLILACRASLASGGLRRRHFTGHLRACLGRPCLGEGRAAPQRSIGVRSLVGRFRRSWARQVRIPMLRPFPALGRSVPAEGYFLGVIDGGWGARRHMHRPNDALRIWAALASWFVAPRASAACA